MSVMLRNLEWVDPRRRSAASTSVYAATRSAVETMTAILAKELRGRNITVNVVAPGPVATDMFPDETEQVFSQRAAIGVRPAIASRGAIRSQNAPRPSHIHCGAVTGAYWRRAVAFAMAATKPSKPRMLSTRVKL